MCNAGLPVGIFGYPACRIDNNHALIECNRHFILLAGAEDGTAVHGRKWFEVLGLCPSEVITRIQSAQAENQPTRVRCELPGLGDVPPRTLNFTIYPHPRSTPDAASCLLIFDAPEQPGQDQRSLSLQLETANRTIAEYDRRLELLTRQKEQEIRAAQEQIQKLYDDINDEMDMARTIQEALVPRKLPESPGFKSAAISIPAGKVGGDFYDVIVTPRRKIAVLIFDVSGHGVPAALIGAMAKMLFSHYIDKLESPADVFTNVNKGLCRFVRSEHYLTAFLGFINPLESTMVFSKAGHVPPVIVHPADQTTTLLETRGFFIGHSALTEIAEYSDETVSLQPGDKILFYTDGLTEGHNASGELYGIRRLLQLIKAGGKLSVKKLLDSIHHDQTSFRQGCPLQDDFTLLAVEIGSCEEFLRESGFKNGENPVILTLNSYEMIEEIASIILREMDRKGYSDRQIKRTKICLFEMMTNAIVHGNAGDPAKNTSVLFKVYPDRAVISVMDEGNGFDYTNPPDPLAPENLLKDSGRGLFIIRRYMDEVHFNARGNRILCILHYEGEGAIHGTRH